MPGGVNKVILVGNLGQDPDLRYTPGGAAVCEMRLATNESWNDKQSGEKKERTEWHRIIVWNKRGEVCGKFLKKGRQIYVEGRITTRQWEDKEGNKRYTTEIIANDVQFLGSKDDGGGGKGYSNREPQGPPAGPSPDDDIPF